MKISHLFTAALFTSVSLLLAPTGAAQLTVSWINQYGSSGDDYGQGITVDTSGRILVAGSTFGNLSGTSAGSGDVFLSRLTAAGSIDFTHQVGGTNLDRGVGLALVGSSTFVGGYTSSDPFDGQTTLGSTDGFIQRYDANGARQGTTRIGGSNLDNVLAVAGNATHLLAAGFAFSSFDGQTPNAGSRDAFLSKRDSTGAVVWTRFAGTSATENGNAASFDTAGNSFLAGNTNGGFSGFTNQGGDDLFVTRYDSTGNQTLLQQIGGTGNEFAYDMQVDVSGNIYLAGDTTGNLGGQSNAGNSDAFLMKLDSAGNVLWTRLFGGTGNDFGSALSLDAAGRIWIAGGSASILPGRTTTTAGGFDAYVAQYDSAGNLLGTAWLGTSGAEFVSGLEISADGAGYVTGYTTGTLEGASAGNADIFVAQVVPEPSTVLLLASAGLGLLVRRRRVS